MIWWSDDYRTRAHREQLLAGRKSVNAIHCEAAGPLSATVACVQLRAIISWTVGVQLCIVMHNISPARTSSSFFLIPTSLPRPYLLRRSKAQGSIYDRCWFLISETQYTLPMLLLWLGPKRLVLRLRLRLLRYANIAAWQRTQQRLLKAIDFKCCNWL